MPEYPQSLVPAGSVAPAPRRVRAVLAGRTVLDTVRARYVWEWPPYPQYYVPLADVDTSLLLDEGTSEQTPRGTARHAALVVGDVHRPGAAALHGADAPEQLRDTVRFEWSALDAWFEEDEEVFVHPRNPYARVDAVRSTRHVRVELDGVVLAESGAPVMVFETGLPPRTYFPRSAVDSTHLVPSTTRTQCPYKGHTSAYWSVEVGGTVHPDLAWSYDFPTRDVLPIAGMVAFFDEKVDVVVDGQRQERPHTPFSD
ncbi:DUF427 domain-containing protein [Geodermatophilus sabuli]|uniref:Uncharacterized conserved protein, DUF427 family n=1 Tax=Geodermatophilus sabuli TaxID=1564158 RepID=A0A285EJH3_9ACTN|nr:DUF427 domain-containing protein [Geodermatophilus sabuli]MBB3086985.1 uncharacterized protein (DUF427 family) [Geodermatophilus sabuli]SNX99235.1 Uncharacterized conserved protein, DUF427 family [Geodermatophilus sabuli]